MPVGVIGEASWRDRSSLVACSRALAVSFFELFLAFGVALQLFSELTANEATACKVTLLTISLAIVRDGGKEERTCTSERLGHYSHLFH